MAINTVDLLIIICLGIYGIILLSGGIYVSSNEYTCTVENSVSNATITSIFLGTALVTLFLCFASLGAFTKRKGINENFVLFKSPTYIAVGIVFVSSIIAISLGAVIVNGIKEEETQDEEEKKACDKVKYGGNIILWTGILLLLTIVALGSVKIYNQYKKTKK
jgi:hypothetical protein